MYCLWKTQGTWVQPWRPDVRIGAEMVDGVLHVVVAADGPWSGRIYFDRPRHAEHLRLPLDWPRINQFPEWFVVPAGRSLVLRDASTGVEQRLAAERIHEGWPLALMAGQVVRLAVRPVH